MDYRRSLATPTDHSPMPSSTISPTAIDQMLDAVTSTATRRLTLLMSSVNVALILLVGQPVSATAAPNGSEWSGWRDSNEPPVQWRSRTHSWGKIIASDCDVEFRINGEGSVNFRYDITYIVDKSAPGRSDHRIGSSYGVTRDGDHPGDLMADCRSVTGVNITRLARRAGPVIDKKSAHNSTREIQKPNPGPGGKSPESRSPPAPTTNVIEFPGAYKGPILTNLRLDSRSLAWMRSQSDAVGKRLLDWRPMHAWAEHRPYTISQQDWDALAVLVAKIDKGRLRDLSSDAMRHASEYPVDSSTRRFWQAMADVYQRGSQR
jgi:hypothetical protein